MGEQAEVFLRTSERKTFKRCPQRWWWAYREGLKPNDTADPLWFGTGVHVALAAWYCGPGLRRGPHPAETWAKYAGDSIRTAKTNVAVDEGLVERWVDLSRLGEVMLNGYVQKYGTDDYIHVIAPEQTFSLDIPWPADLGSLGEILDTSRKFMVIYKGTFDLPFRHLGHGKVMIGETKTAKAISTKHLTLDDQAGAYWAVADRVLKKQGLIKPRETVAGIEYNFLRKGEPDDRPRDADGYCTNKPTKADYNRALMAHDPMLTEAELKKMKLETLAETAEQAGLLVLGERSKSQPPALFHREIIWRTRPERRQQLMRIQEEALWMELVRQGIMEPVKHTERDCSWCEFFELCELDEQQVDTREFRSLQYRVEDPYADHREEH